MARWNRFVRVVDLEQERRPFRPTRSARRPGGL